MNPRVLIARFSRQTRALRERTLLAPLAPGGRVRARLDGQIYEFAPTQRFVGWGRIRPLSEREAELTGEAPPAQRLAYLEIFPVLAVVLLWPDPNPDATGTWWALPYNENNASQRFSWNGAEPVRVHLCDPEKGAEPFARVLTRIDGDTLWYDGADPLANPARAELLRDTAAKGALGPAPPARLLSSLAPTERLALTYAWIRDLDPARAGGRPNAHRTARQGIPEAHAWLRRAVVSTRLEGRLQHTLAKTDAELHSFREVVAPDGTTSQILVEWSERGKARAALRRYRSPIDPAPPVVASGICLSGDDLDLTSLVGIMVETPN